MMTWPDSFVNQILCGDSVDIMRIMPKASVDAIITSPPYNLGDVHHTQDNRFSPYPDNMPEQEYQDWQVEVLTECIRVLKPRGSIFYNHKNRIRNGRQITPYEWILRVPGCIVKQEIIWLNGSPNFDKCRFYPMTERVYWLAKSTRVDFRNNLSHHDCFCADEWRPQGTSKEHPRTFPLQMVLDFLDCLPPKIIVLDPFMGLGTTALGAVETKNTFIGIDIDREYCELARTRLHKHLRQLTLF